MVNGRAPAMGSTGYVRLVAAKLVFAQGVHGRTPGRDKLDRYLAAKARTGYRLQRAAHEALPQVPRDPFRIGRDPVRREMGGDVANVALQQEKAVRVVPWIDRLRKIDHHRVPVP